MKKESHLKENRENLKAMSNGVKTLVKEGVYSTINEALADLYKKQGHEELKKFLDWKNAGKTVKKGEHALLLWGQPRGKKKEDSEEDEYSFFPVCYVFSNLQVI